MVDNVDNPVIIDDRAGSVGYWRPLRDIAVKGRLEYGDASFLGYGPLNKAIPIGIEIKTIEDTLNCIWSGRFAGHQLPGLLSNYERVYLLIQGNWRTNVTSGVLEVPRGRKWRSASWAGRQHTGKSFHSWLISMEQLGGIHVRTFHTKQDLANFIRYTYSWFQKGWDEHESCAVFDQSSTHYSFTKPGLLRRMAAQLPGIGFQTLSKRVESQFRTPYDMVLASVDEWAEITGIGKKMAERIYNALRSGR